MDRAPRLDGKVALVLGGSRGIGEAIVRRLAREGAPVALTYLTSPEKAAEVARAGEAERVPALTIRADSGGPVAVNEAINQMLARFGRLDIVVVNAGILMRGMHEDPVLGPVRQPRPAARFSETLAAVRQLAPYLGADNAEVMDELGYPAEIQRLTLSGVLCAKPAPAVA